MSATSISAPRPRVGREGLTAAAEQMLFAVIPVLAVIGLTVFLIDGSAVATDFHWAYYPAALRLIHGANPYTITHAEVLSGTAFVYPALSALAFAPFALLGLGVAQFLYMLLCIACIPAMLWALGVRDWRIHGIALLWLPTYSGWQTGNVTLPLALMIALTWRYRERPAVAGLLTAAAISLKPFVWPLALWLLATRRVKATAATILWAIPLNLVAWGIVGFGQIRNYTRLSGQVTDALWHGGYSMLAVVHHLGLGRGAGEGLLLLVSAAAAGALVYAGLVRRDERLAMTLTVVLMLVASPLVWVHYFALLLVPFALTRPRLSLVWAAPILMWVCPPAQAVVGWQEWWAWIVAGGSLVVLLARWGGGGPLAATFWGRPLRHAVAPPPDPDPAQ